MPIAVGASLRSIAFSLLPAAPRISGWPWKCAISSHPAPLLLAAVMLSPARSFALPLGILFLLSLALSGTDARATPNPQPVSSQGQTINLMRRGLPQRSSEDPLERLQKHRLATHAKYGVGTKGGNQKRASGLNLYVHQLLVSRSGLKLIATRLTNLQYDSTYVDPYSARAVY